MRPCRMWYGCARRWRECLRTAKDDAGIVRWDGVGRSSDLDRRVVEPAQVQHDIQLQLETMYVGSGLVKPEVQAGAEIVHAIEHIVDALLARAWQPLKLVCVFN